MSEKTLIVGAGKSGANMVLRLREKGIKTPLAIADTDKRTLAAFDDEIPKLLIGRAVTQGMGAKGSIDAGVRSANSARDVLERIVAGCELIVLLGGMGGGTASAALSTVAETAKKQDATVVAFVTFPLDLERTKQAVAEDAIVALGRVADAVYVLDDNKIAEMASVSEEQAYSVADEVIARSVTRILSGMEQDALLRMDLEEFRHAVGDKGVSVVGFGEAEGENRAQHAVDEILKTPLMSTDLQSARGLVVDVTGGSVTTDEARAIGEKLRGELRGDAAFALCAHADASLGEGIEVIALFGGVHSPYVGGKVERQEGQKSSAGAGKYAIRGKDGTLKKGIIEI